MIPPVKALVFDVFGTVVDWRSSIMGEGRALARRKGLTGIDWARFADAWRDGYGPAMEEVRTGKLPWMRIDDLHRRILDRILAQFQITGLSESDIDHFHRAWHRLDPWPDTIEGLARMKRLYPIATLSNGNMSLLMNMARNAGLPWDMVLSAELARHYKPDREAYLMAADYLGVKPGELMLVAAHPDDLRGAAAAGLRTAYVHRPLERGPGSKANVVKPGDFDLLAKDFVDLAAQFEAKPKL